MAEPWFDIREFVRGGPMPPMDWAPIFEHAIHSVLNSLGLATYRTDPPKGNAGTLYLPIAEYPIRRPILIARQGMGTFHPCSISIVGEAASQHVANPELPRAKILTKYQGDLPFEPPNLKLPAIIIQGAQTILLKNLSIVGENLWLPDTVDPPADLIYHYLEFPGQPDPYRLLDARDNPGSPYAGICIDPFHPEVPLDRRYPGQSSNYLPGPPSKDVRVEDCEIRGFVVGVVISPSGRIFAGSHREDDTLLIENTKIAINKSNLSVGGPRKVVLQSVHFGAAKYAINCLDYGAPGDCPSLFGGRVASVRDVFRTSSTGVSVIVNQLHTINILGLGQIGVRSPEKSRPDANLEEPEPAPPVPVQPIEPFMDIYQFNGCDFSFANPQDLTTPLPVMNAHLINRAHASFHTCRFRPNRKNEGATDPPIHILNQGLLSFQDCTFTTTDGFSKQDLGSQFWVTGDLAAVSHERTTTLDVPTPALGEQNALLSETCAVPDFHSAPYLLSPLIRGQLVSTYTKTTRLRVPPSVLWVRGDPPRISLGLQVVADWIDLLENAQGAGTWFIRFLVPPGLAQVGDLLTSTQPFAGVVDAFVRRHGQLILGRITEVTRSFGLDDVRLEYMPIGLLPGLYAMGAIETIPIHVLTLARAHPPTRGQVTNGSAVIRDVEILPKDTLGRPVVSLQEAWVAGNRIFGRGITPGTFVTQVTASEIHLSRAVQGASGATHLRDAGVYTIATQEL